SLIKHFEIQLKKIPLFRTKLIQAPGRFARPYWLVDDDFDMEFHLRHIALPKPGDWRQLCILIARLHSRPIDMSRPLWESYVIEGLDNIEGLPKGCFVIYTKIHHSIVDGGGADDFMAAIHDLEPMVHEDEEEETFEAEQMPGRNDLILTSTQNYIGNIWNLTKGSYGLMNDIGKSAVKLAKGELKAPPTSAPATRFNNPVSPHRVIESAVFSLEDFKAVKNKTGTKINDVALAVIGGALRKYLDAHEEHPEKSLVASVPINMRTRTGDNGDANQVGAIFASLNSDIDSPVERILRIHKNTDEAKEFGQEAPLKDALKLVGALSPRVTKMLVNAYVDNKITKHLPMKINTVISNVAGPNFPLYCSGAKLLNYHGVGVLTPGVGIFHLVFSYCGKLSVTILADRQMMPDPEFYRQCMDDAFAELQQAVETASEDEILAIKLKIEQEGKPAPKAIEPPADEVVTDEKPGEEAAKEGKLIKAAPSVGDEAPKTNDAPKPKRKVAAKRKASTKSQSVKKAAARRVKAASVEVTDVVSEEKKVS
ncbi:MAG: wax ester/triacylglycerol synthase family O-acyltransferase, partial [Cellvibrionales bacterium]|nr:wax ester/triacylglycerol synthase family O-acyltransferase [Cellvibrionales bacterium]